MATHKVSDASFEKDVLQSDTPVVVDFWAEWCGPCKMIGPSLEEIATEMKGKVKIAKVNVDENPGVAGQLGVHKTTVLRLLRPLTEEHFTYRDEQHRYHLGARLLELAAAAADQRTLNQKNSDIDDVYAWRDFTPAARTAAYDDFGHGTHVGGIIAGTGANSVASKGFSVQYKGIAPGAKASVWGMAGVTPELAVELWNALAVRNSGRPTSGSTTCHSADS